MGLKAEFAFDAGFAGVNMLSWLFLFYDGLEGAARYAGLLLAPAEGFGLRPRPSANSFFCPSGKKNLFMSVLAQILIIFGDQ